MDYWINGLLDCCKSRRYAENNAFIIFKMPFFISIPIPCVLAFS